MVKSIIKGENNRVIYTLTSEYQIWARKFIRWLNTTPYLMKIYARHYPAPNLDGYLRVNDGMLRKG